MDRLRALQVFSEVAKTGSFVKASTRLHISKATVTKHVAWLEETLGAQLLQRTSRQVALTEAGWRLLGGAREMLERYEAIEADLRDSVRLPRGLIRIGSPPSFGAWHLVRLLAQFNVRYPDIEVNVFHDDGRSDLIAEALDLSIRILPTIADASYVAQSLMKAPQVLVASPEYFRTHPRPKIPADLSRHNCLVHTIKSAGNVWRFLGHPTIEVKVRGSICSNMGDALKNAALVGLGISVHPYYMVATELAQGQLVEVLPAFTPEPTEIHVVFSTRRNMPARVRHLLEFLKEWARQPPEWSIAAGKPTPAPRAKRNGSGNPSREG